MKIYIISPSYPAQGHPANTFIKQVVDEWADQGHECVAIAPFSVTKSRWLAPKKEIQTTSKGNTVLIYRPHYISFSNFHIGKFYFSAYFKQKAFNRVLRKLQPDADFIYGHFWANAICGYWYAKKYNIPIFVACGESTLSKSWGLGVKKEFANFVKGVICVSTKNKNECVNLGLVPSEKCVVFPNAYNPAKFYKIEKEECRRKLGFPHDAFIVCSVGRLCHRKGTALLSRALDSINDSNIYSIFIGSDGDEVPTCKNILYKGIAQHEVLKYYLNASDVFVLPTLAEGCSNAIIEAIGCGMPVISSDLPFNWDVLDQTNSLLINPQEVNEIAAAILKIKVNSELREELERGSINKAVSLTISNRAEKIIEFIKQSL